MFPLTLADLMRTDLLTVNQARTAAVELEFLDEGERVHVLLVPFKGFLNFLNWGTHVK